MTFDPTKPDASESPSVAPAQLQTNFARLKTIISGDHQFNDSLATNDGFHNKVSLINNTVAAVPGPANTVMYAKSDALGTGTSRSETFSRNASLECPLALRAYVMFTGRGDPGACTINGGFGVSGVQRTTEGNYTVTFTGLPTSKYTVSCVAQPIAGSTRVLMPLNGADYTTAQTTTTLKLRCVSTDGTNRDFGTGHVLIYGG